MFGQGANMIEIITAAVVSSLVSTLIWIFKDKILYQRSIKKQNLELLKKLYTDVAIVGKSINLERNEELNQKINESIGSLGFYLRVYFPSLHNQDYENFLQETLMLKAEIQLRLINGNLDDNFLESIYIPRMITINNFAKKIYDNLVSEALKNT